MKCDEAKHLLVNTPGPAQRLALQLHLARCRACRAEAAQARTLDTALASLPRFAPPTDLLSVVLSVPQKAGLAPAARKETTGMRRLVYVVAFLVAIGLLVGGLMTSPRQESGGTLLVAAAHAMGVADTLHVRGEFNLADEYDPWCVEPGSYERWYSPEGFRCDFYDRDGRLTRSIGGLVSTGEAWQFYPGWLGFHMADIARQGPEAACAAGGAERPRPDSEPAGALFLYQVGSEKLAAFVKLNRERFANGHLRLAAVEERGHGWRELAAEWQGRRVTMIEEDLGPDLVSGHPRGCIQYYLDPATARFVGLRQYGPEAEDSPLQASVGFVEYDVDVPTDLFSPDAADGADVLDGQHYTRPSGDLLFMPGADDRVASLTGVATEDRHYASMGASPWEQAESSYLAVLEEDPDNSMAREYLGRMYTRWGLYDEALVVLPEVDCGWSALNRAFCYDALGQRDNALELYEKLKDYGHDSIAQWARLGLKRPTWPSDLDIKAEPGEFLLKPRPSWNASAFNSSHPFTPEAAIDGDRATRWGSAGDPSNDGQAPGNWFQLDFGEPTRVSRIVLDHQGIYNIYTNDWPRGIRASYTSDGKTWHDVAASPAGPMQPVTVRFDPAETVRTIRFETTEYHTPEWWSIHETYVFAPVS